MIQKDNAKRTAGIKAAEYIRAGMIVGLGTGSTVAYTMEKLAERIKSEGLSIKGVPTSVQTALKARSYGIPLISADEFENIDITIDGADQIDRNLCLIKGRGAAHVRERIIADASKELIIVADTSKLCDELSGPVPIEVIPFALGHVMSRLKQMGGNPEIREGVKKDGPVFSDNGNIIIDYKPGTISDPVQLETTINNIPGVVSCGIFTEFTKKTIVIIGSETGPKIIRS
jgi:ribose 5-phosphate isomerase A